MAVGDTRRASGRCGTDGRVSFVSASRVAGRSLGAVLAKLHWQSILLRTGGEGGEVCKGSRRCG